MTWNKIWQEWKLYNHQHVMVASLLKELGAFQIVASCWTIKQLGVNCFSQPDSQRYFVALELEWSKEGKHNVSWLIAFSFFPITASICPLTIHMFIHVTFSVLFGQYEIALTENLWKIVNPSMENKSYHTICMVFVSYINT